MTRPVGTIARGTIGIRGRVVWSFLVLLVLAEVASVVALWQVGSVRIHEQATRDLATAADDLNVRLSHVQGMLGSPGGPTLSSVFDDYLRARPARGDQAYLAFVGGRPFAASFGAPTPLDQLALAGTWATTRTTASGQVETPAGPMRWLAVPITSGDTLLGVLVATEFVASQYDVLRDTMVTATIITLLILVGACLLAWVAAGRALAPLRELSTTASSVTSGDQLDARIEVRSHDEVGVLATSFNEMLDRLQEAFASQKQFLDDAGHELRTPITIARGHVELLDDDPGVRAEEVALVLDELDRMDRLVGDLRVLARSGRPDFLDLAPIDVRDLMDELQRKAPALAKGERIISVRTTAAGTVRADRQRLTQAVLNMVDNAVHATESGATITLSASERDGALVLRVSDHGPGISPDDLPTLFDRTERTIGRRPGGTGLGLPIVAAIAKAHGGSVTVDSALGVGTTFEICLPGFRAATGPSPSAQHPRPPAQGHDTTAVPVEGEVRS